MGISMRVGRSNYEIGTPSFFKSFFSTIFVRLEDEDWASRFPIIMDELYAGKISPDQTGEALDELEEIRAELEEFDPDQAVWDFDDRRAKPPWGSDDMSPTITSLANYFWTSDGKNLLDVLEEALREARAKKRNILVE